MLNKAGRKQPNPTIKQKKFAQAVADGASLADAYRSSYDVSNSSKTTIQVNASKLAATANVLPLIEAAKARNDRGNERSLGNRRRWILDKLINEAEDPENPAASRVKSLELLGKLAGMFDSERERSEKREHATEQQLEAELLQRLSEIIEKPLEVLAVSSSDDHQIEASSESDKEEGHPAV